MQDAEFFLMISRSSLAAGLVTMLAAVSSAEAATYNFTSGTASASINNTTGVVTITNSFASTHSAADLISGLLITFATTPGTVALTTSAGQLINMDAGADTGTLVAGSPDHWNVAQSGKVVTLATVGLGGGMPRNMIIGPGTGASSPFTYTGINSSVDNFNNSIWKTGTFTLSGIVGLVVSGVKFEYGTGPDTISYLIPPGSCDGCAPGPGETPIPGTIFLMGSVLGAGIGVSALRRRRKARTV
jgi:hypothetical protein